jgi:hypothetical protein
MNKQKTLPKVRVKTTGEPLRCPTCRKEVSNISVIRRVIHDGGYREYLLRSGECGHLFKTTLV